METFITARFSQVRRQSLSDLGVSPPDLNPSFPKLMCLSESMHATKKFPLTLALNLTALALALVRSY